MRLSFYYCYLITYTFQLTKYGILFPLTLKEKEKTAIVECLLSICEKKKKKKISKKTVTIVILFDYESPINSTKS